MKQRCGWASTELDIIYHDTEWAVPLYDDDKLFEFLILEGAQAGLSWTTVLKKRAAYREAYLSFKPSIVAKFDQQKQQSLLEDKGIIRNKLKIQSSIKNAQAFLNIQQEFGSFADYLWQFVDHKTIINHWQTLDQIPSETPLSQTVSKELKKRGFNFVGPTICYALMQATGLVNDHLISCPRHHEVQATLNNS